MKVRKRDGSLQDFDFEKMIRSIEAASDEVGEPMTLSDLQNVSKEVEKILKSKFIDEVSYMDIRDAISAELKNSGFEDVAKAYSEF
ncbi:ATP cone domain-containing protein [Caloramator quimbayensis]|uniref:ATP cone domain-containing protein n=1 Tax=Caloramator quimbayensis TaxID=1147123 RepID=A0A1T4Y1A1_9CLOT|nr:ATP cone domain-containing protein [Caloramator quimbayensis]SKA95091.1 ATP cone domain-containing protein [Caloramator quimbayensis]